MTPRRTAAQREAPAARVRQVFAVGLVAFAVAITVRAAGSNDVRLVDAAREGNWDVVRVLLKQHADVNASGPDGTTALHWAVRADDLETAQLLVRAGAAVDAANRYGVTPLTLAATNGNGATVELLLKAGANANTALPEGETVLMTASRTGRVEAIQSLLAHGADVHATEGWLGETALMWAAAEDHAAAVQVLLDAGAEINLRSAPAKVPSPDGRRIGLVPTDLPRGSWTSLMYAARQGALNTTRTLIENGADLNLADRQGTTALILAIINSHYDLANTLIEKGADPNLADKSGMTPLYSAVDMHTLGWMQGRPDPKPTDKLDSVDIAKALIKHGASPNAQLLAPVLQRAHTAGDASLGAGATPFIRAAKWGDITLMQLLLDNGADPALKQKNHTTALMIAAGLGKRAAGEVADTDPRERGTEQGAIEAIKLCLDHGVDVNAVNDNGDAALHGAVVGGDDILRFLVEHGARVDVENRLKQTPLDVAIRVRGDRSTAAMLLRQAKRTAGSTPLQ